MKIKYNNFFIITPIFLTISLVMALLNYSNERTEVNWGLKTKADAISTPSRIFIEHMLQKETLSNVLKEIEPKFDRILDYGQANRFYISQDDKVLLDTQEQKEKTVVLEEIKDTKVSSIYTKNGHAQVTIHTPIKGAPKNTYLSVEIDAHDAAEQLHTAIYEMIFTVLIISIMGLISAYILSKIVTAKILSLNKTAQAIARGNYSDTVHIGSIHEFTDLGDTLTIMKSIMKEIIHKTKNMIIEEEKFRSEDDIIHTYKQSFFRSKTASLGEVNLSIIPLGNPETGYFFNTVESDGKLYGFIGKTASSASTLDTAIQANAVQDYISHQLSQGKFDLVKLQKLFELSYLEIICIHADTSLHNTQVINAEVEEREMTLENDSELLICEPNLLATKEMNIYLHNYPELSSKELCQDLVKLFDEKVDAPFMLIKSS